MTSDSSGKLNIPLTGTGPQRPILNPTLEGELSSLSGFFVTPDEQEQSLATYLADSAFSMTSVVVEDIVELLAFWVADEEYAVDILAIREIMKVPDITEVPRAADEVLGVISLRGTVVPILDLRIVLGLPVKPASKNSRVLVLRANEEPVGLLVDKVTNVVRVEKDALEAKPRTMQLEAGDVIQGVGRVDERVIIVLDADAVVETVEKNL